MTRGDRLLRAVSGVAAVIPTGILVVIAAVMFVTALPSILFSGFSFFTGSVFNFGNLYATTTITHNGVQAPPHAVYGVLPLIAGTLTTSVIALVLAVPISVGGVLMLSEIIPRRIADSVAVFLELLAGIPSVVFGLWGVAVFGPFLSAHVFPALTAIGHIIPFFKGPVGQGQGLLTASLVLAVMIIPIVASTTRELVRRVPILAKEGALALGMTRYETVRVVTIPYIRTGIMDRVDAGRRIRRHHRSRYPRARRTRIAAPCDQPVDELRGPSRSAQSIRRGPSGGAWCLGRARAGSGQGFSGRSAASPSSSSWRRPSTSS